MNITRPPLGSVILGLVTALAMNLALFSIVADAWAQDEGRNKPRKRLGFVAPQLAMEEDGTLLMLWARQVGDGHELSIAYRPAHGEFSDPFSVTSGSGSVKIIEFDEFRPSITTGPKGAINVVWTDTKNNMMLATGSDHGRKFNSPVQLNGGGQAARGFPAVAMLDKTVYAVWIDSRHAPANQEEPAHLYMASVNRGQVVEENITAELTPSVCGCCRPALVATRSGELEVYFRNTDKDGYRDMFKMTRGVDGAWSKPVRLGPARWKIEGCPAAGPVVTAGGVVWRDMATGDALLVASRDPAIDLEQVGKSDDAHFFSHSPRRVHSREKMPVVYAPGSPNGRAYGLRGGRWQVVMENVPEWCTDMAWLEGQVLMVGDIATELKLEARPVNW